MLFVRRDHAVVLLAELNADLVDEAQVGQVLELAITVNAVANVAALADVDVGDGGVLVDLR